LVNRLGKIAERCSDLLYSNVVIPIEDIKIISMLIQEFADKFHHGKEEKAYFPEHILSFYIIENNFRTYKYKKSKDDSTNYSLVHYDRKKQKESIQSISKNINNLCLERIDFVEMILD
jgi:hypothetical protein